MERTQAPAVATPRTVHAAAQRAAAAISALCDIAREVHNAPGPKPSSRTRSQRDLSTFSMATIQKPLTAELHRVMRFAYLLYELPYRDSDIVEFTRCLCGARPEGDLPPHRNSDGRLEHCDILPSLRSLRDGDAAEAVRALALPGALHPAWISADAGTVTLPHPDRGDDHKRIGTTLVMLKGEQLFIAWKEATPRVEADILEELTRPVPVLTLMLRQPTLTVRVMSYGDSVRMPAGTVHMVITSAPKLVLSCHHR